MGLRERVISLVAGDARERAYKRHALGDDAIHALAVDLATLRQTAYHNRLKEIANPFGHRVKADDPDVALRLVDALDNTRALAAGIVATHNRKLKNFVTGVSDAQIDDIDKLVAGWAATRAQFKSQQIACQQGMIGRYQADQDVISKNNLSIRAQMIPRTADEEHCADIIARGWMTRDEIDFTIPVHVNCEHSLEYDMPFSEALSGKDRIWIGDWFGADSGANAV